MGDRTAVAELLRHLQPLHHLPALAADELQRSEQERSIANTWLAVEKREHERVLQRKLVIEARKEQLELLTHTRTEVSLLQ